MVVYAFYIFDRHAECIYKKKWTPRQTSSTSASASASVSSTRPTSSSGQPVSSSADASGPGSGSGSGAAPQIERTARALSAEDDAKLVFGCVFSLRNMVRRLGGEEDAFVSFRTGEYKLHYYETPTSLKFVMMTDTKTNNLRIVLHQIYVGLFVEYVVKNPLAPVEHSGKGVNCEMFELGLEQFIVEAEKGLGDLCALLTIDRAAL